MFSKLSRKQGYFKFKSSKEDSEDRSPDGWTDEGTRQNAYLGSLPIAAFSPKKPRKCDFLVDSFVAVWVVVFYRDSTTRTPINRGAEQKGRDISENQV